MQIIDANAILWYLMKDNAEQFEISKQVIEEGACTTLEVLSEVVYVLSGVYSVPRKEISWMLHCLLFDVDVINPNTFRYALAVYKQTNLDFVDCILVAYNKTLNFQVFTFDKKLKKTINSELMIFQA